jgi:hypothetical protein
MLPVTGLHNAVGANLAVMNRNRNRKTVISHGSSVQRVIG